MYANECFFFVCKKREINIIEEAELVEFTNLKERNSNFMLDLDYFFTAVLSIIDLQLKLIIELILYSIYLFFL